MDRVVESCIDVETDTPITYYQYTFPNSGVHQIKVAWKEYETYFSSVFERCDSLTSIPSGLFDNCTKVTSFNGTFSGCRALKNIPSDLFLNNTNVTSFSNTFRSCYNLTSSCPIDSDGRPIYNRSESGKNGYSIVYNHYRCFYNCTKMSDYSSIPTDWK